MMSDALENLLYFCGFSDSEFRVVEEKLRSALRIIGRWEHISNELTAMQWADTGPGRHTWKGKYNDTVLGMFRERLEECLKMREANEEVRKLLTADEINSLSVEHVGASCLSLSYE